MLFWHGQPDHYWSSAGDMYPLPPSGVLRDPPVLPYLKQEEPNGISTSQPEFPAFQYILCAPTSPAVRHHEETLTYLNQGQSYEIRMVGTPRGDPAEGRRMVKSVVRVSFHDRRLQYSEQQQLEGWRWSRPGDRILDIDIPLSVGVLEPQIHPTLLNTVEFLWDPSRRTSVFVQVHCISTEFTLRKNGGEKGVPFRIQIDTFGAGGKGDPPEHLHSASCLVKVFKPKGADRKLKTDREKVEKQPPPEREKFQPSYENTVLAECAPWPDALGAPHSPPGTPGLPTPHPFKLLSPERGCVSPACAAEGPAESPGEALSPCASPLETQQWLLRRRFSTCARVFANFTGADLLKLSRRDLIQICGAPDGIRLCHALAGRAVPGAAPGAVDRGRAHREARGAPGAPPGPDPAGLPAGTFRHPRPRQRRDAQDPPGRDQFRGGDRQSPRPRGLPAAAAVGPGPGAAGAREGTNPSGAELEPCRDGERNPGMERGTPGWRAEPWNGERSLAWRVTSSLWCLRGFGIPPPQLHILYICIYTFTVS
ncbi:transcription factor CP2-like protein 1 isoform X3 [Manacus candei]|uniref:transcription factor CP2-like protein 1 isoform X3 n=1 Tax=Manacus candei TaxID=415023 RepID=UPI002227EA09|nr:transcription factor CP2-like protein 1 isoform X3 [Manacus candei]